MRQIVFSIFFIAFGSWSTIYGTSEQSGFYDFKGAGKSIVKLQKLLLAGNVDFTYGLQAYNQNKITSAACFYNQPSNVLHYVLTNENNHTIHFLIPVLNLDHVNHVDSKQGDKSYIELVYADKLGMKVKEHNDKSRIIYRLQFTSFPVPIDDSIDGNDVVKQFEKIIKKAKKFKAS